MHVNSVLLIQDGTNMRMSDNKNDFLKSSKNAVRTKDTLPLSDKRSKVQPLLKKNTLPLSDKRSKKLVSKKKSK